jgi:cytochrome b subunit of formate dehydrogenase
MPLDLPRSPGPDNAAPAEPIQPVVQRYRRPARWLHTAIYLTVLILLATGWWFVLDKYRDPSPLADVLGVPDTTIHEITGYAVIAVVAASIAVGVRASVSFVRASLRFDQTDRRWFARWPAAVFTGRFPHHRGHFDPGQRVANLVMLIALVSLAGSGLGMLFLPAGPVSLVLPKVHRWSTFVVTPVVLGHVLIAAGVLPGYRGVWRSMHLGGRLPVDVARRIWPDSLDQSDPPAPGS